MGGDSRIAHDSLVSCMAACLELCSPLFLYECCYKATVPVKRKVFFYSEEQYVVPVMPWGRYIII